jgi:hypothetical protein
MCRSQSLSVISWRRVLTRTPNAKSRHLPSAGTVTDPAISPFHIRMSSINRTRNIVVDGVNQRIEYFFSDRSPARVIYDLN